MGLFKKRSLVSLPVEISVTWSIRQLADVAGTNTPPEYDPKLIR